MPTPDRIRKAAAEAERAKSQLASTLGALQYRLKPGTLMSNAWDGVREKGGEMADGAMQAVKERPMTATGILAGIVLLLAREPLWRLVSGLFSSGEEQDEHIITAHLKDSDGKFDLTAPTAPRAAKEGVNA